MIEKRGWAIVILTGSVTEEEWRWRNLAQSPLQLISDPLK
jgi:hypothetical protein